MSNNKFIHIPIEEATTPVDGATVMMNRWWTVYKEGHTSVNIGSGKQTFDGSYRTYTPQCNTNENIANRRGKKQAVFLPIVYFVDRLSEEIE